MSVEQPGRPEISGADLPLASSLSRKCSTCGRTGHNSRTCLESREAVAAAQDSATLPTSEQARQQVAEKGGVEDEGAASDESQGGNQREGRKKGVAWTEEEHRLFLLGLQKLGKGDWRGISRHYVQTRSPTQVASHAQKYFIRQSIAGKRKRRSSLFDLVPDQQPVKEVGSSHAKSQQGREQKKEAQPTVELPQMTHAQFPGLMPGGGPEALALAYYYQALMAQQNPMQWLQAMYGQSQPSQMFVPPPPALAAMMASGQGFLPPHLLQQGFLGVQQPGTNGGQQPGISVPNQALASAFLAQQQQMAAAFALSMNPEATLQQNGKQSGNDPAPRPPSRGSIPGAPEMPQSNTYWLGYPREPLARFPVNPVKMDGRRTETEQSRAREASGESSMQHGGRTEIPREAFGYGRLVRPKAKKAQPASGSFGEMPSYMRSSQEPHSHLGSVSAESQETGLRLLNCQPPSGRFAAEMSGSTNGCFSLGADEQSATRGSRTTPAWKDREALPSRASERSSPDEVPYRSLAAASTGAGSDESRSMNASPTKAERLSSVRREFN